MKDLDWIRNSSISYGKEEIYKKIYDKILEYVKKKLGKGKYVSRQEIFKKFRVNPDSYFSGGTKEIYKKLGLDPELIPNYRMSRNFDKEQFKKRIIAFVKETIKNGHFPTHKEIQRKFRCLVKLHFLGGIREIARLAGIKYNRKFATSFLYLLGGAILWIIVSIIGGLMEGISGERSPILRALMYIGGIIMIIGPVICWIIIPLKNILRKRKEK